MIEYIVPIAVMLVIVVLVIGPPGMMLVAMTYLAELFGVAIGVVLFGLLLGVIDALFGHHFERR